MIILVDLNRIEQKLLILHKPNMLRSITALALLASSALCIDHNLFRNCSRVPFCSSLRHKILDENQQFKADHRTIVMINNVIDIPLNNANGDTLKLQLSLLAGKKMRVKILEENHSRYELSDVLDGRPIVTSVSIVIVSNYVSFISINDRSQYIRVHPGPPFQVEFYYGDILEAVLKGDRLIVDNSSQAFAFEVEFVSNKLYGLHHHAHNVALSETADGSSDPFRLRNSDATRYETHSTMALYGAVPAIYGHSPNFTSGIFLHNAAEQWVDISYANPNRPSAYFMVESGTLDLFVMLGPTPQEVVRQFTDLTGVAHLPQLWTLGYHQCRYSYQSQEDVKAVVANMNSYDFPMDAIWLDIDHTDGKRYFTWNPETFSDPVEMQNNISSTYKKLVTIIDPHLKVDETYAVYAGANASGFLAKWENGSNYEGQSSSGTSSWMDFLNPEARAYYAAWYSYEKFNGSTETLAGIWNDMNEPAISEPNHENTMPFEVLHAGGVLHRDVHNIYGFLNSMATHDGLMQRDNGTKRPFVLTRSHFAGSQRYAAMRTGDNIADWPYLSSSYSECLTSNIVGMVFCGADIGGFLGNPQEQLLQRWYQAAVWLPFFRSHSNADTPRREPYLFSNEIQTVIRNAIKLRYKHIPVWYMLFYEHSRYGDPVIRPLFYSYPEVFESDDHVLIGTDILARPVLVADATSVEVNFPGADTFWYRVDDDSWSVHIGNTSENVEVDISDSPFYYRAGSIIVRKDTERLSTVEMRNDAYTIYVNFDADGRAEGRLYEDDYTSFNYLHGSSYLYLNLTASTSSSGVQLSIIDGDSNGFSPSFHRIVYHSPTDSEIVYTTTSDGTPLHTVDILKEMGARGSGELILGL